MHATAVAFGPRGGVLIIGPSGAGKSRLALALIQNGAQLVADDQVFLTACNNALFARTPRSIAGMIEARGVGILRMAHRHIAQISVLVELGGTSAGRMPTPQTREISGVTLPCLQGDPESPFARAVSHYIASLT